jgi:hypothetical protein
MNSSCDDAVTVTVAKFNHGHDTHTHRTCFTFLVVFVDSKCVLNVITRVMFSVYLSPARITDF